MTKKEDILAAGMTVFLEEGLRGARMERIAETGKVSKRTLYKYFENKEALFDAISGTMLETLSSMQVPKFDPDLPIKTQILKAVHIYYAHVTTPYFINGSRVLLAELMRNPNFAKEFNESFAKVDAPLADFLEEAMECGHLRRCDPSFAADRLLALFKSTIFLPLLMHNVSAKDTEFLEGIASESVEVFLLQFHTYSG